jgi:hypothetical protein
MPERAKQSEKVHKKKPPPKTELKGSKKIRPFLVVAIAGELPAADQ